MNKIETTKKNKIEAALSQAIEKLAGGSIRVAVHAGKGNEFNITVAASKSICKADLKARNHIVLDTVTDLPAIDKWTFHTSAYTCDGPTHSYSTIFYR